MPYKSPVERLKWIRRCQLRRFEFQRDYKLAKGCLDCGYNKHHAALVFDHVPGRHYNYKKLSFARSESKLLVEMELCDVVCASCHAIRTFERGEHKGTQIDVRKIVVGIRPDEDARC